MILLFNGLLVAWVLLNPGSDRTLALVVNTAQFVGPLLALPLCFGGLLRWKWRPRVSQPDVGPTVITVGPTSGWETLGRHFHLSSPPKHKGSASSGPTNCAVLTTRASVRSLPGLRSTQATSRPLNSRIIPAARRRARASGPSCGGRPSPAVAASFK